MALIWNAVRRYTQSNGFDNVDLLMRKINEPFMDHELEDHNISFLMPNTIPGLQSLKDLGYARAALNPDGVIDTLSQLPAVLQKFIQ